VTLVALADSLLHQALHNPSEKASGLPEVGEKVHKAHCIRPQYGKAWYVLANMAAMLRDWDSAIDFGRRSIKLGYDDPAVYLCLSVALREDGKKTESKKALEMYNKKDREKFARRFVDTVVKPKSVESRKIWVDRVINDFDYVMHEIIGVER
jgi:tetratricopeptide (TPR) repeat protein